jgi:uncharacterized protein YlxW (UPF0749 family)
MKRCIFKSLLSLSLAASSVVFLGAFFTVVSEQRSHEEVVARQMEVEQHLARLDTITTQLATQANDDSKRLDKLESAQLPVMLAQVQTTIQYDHTLMWFIVTCVAILLIDRIGNLLFLVRRTNHGKGEN